MIIPTAKAIVEMASNNKIEGALEEIRNLKAHLDVGSYTKYEQPNREREIKMLVREIQQSLITAFESEGR